MHVVVAMSGGVDSSVAAALLLDQGHQVTGVFLRSGVTPGPHAARGKQGCCTATDALDAARVADRLDVPFYSLDFSRDFEAVIDDFVREYAEGRTPNPCVDCNRDLKFGKLQRFAESIGADAVATGHYAQRVEKGGRQGLRIPTDRRKDQTYVLFPLSQGQLAGTLFPLALMTKEETRLRATALGFSVAEKPESMEICFVPSGDYRTLLAQRAPQALVPGPIVHAVTGRSVGEHRGVGSVTIGQRRGLGIAGAGTPLYVTEVDAATNRVFVGGAADLLRREVVVGRWNAVSVPKPPCGETVQGFARVRRNHEPQPVQAVVAVDGTVRLHFDPPVKAPAPGQALVLYDGDGFVLGGGWIQSSR